MADFDHDPEALAWAEKAVAEAQRAALLSLAAEIDASYGGLLTPPANLARARAPAISDPQVEDEPAEQAHPASSPVHTAAGESGPVQPGTEGEKRGSGDVSAAPRVFHIGNQSQEIPLDYLRSRLEQWETDPVKSIEIAPGVRVRLMSTGDYILPGRRVAWGARIFVWREMP